MLLLRACATDCIRCIRSSCKAERARHASCRPPPPCTGAGGAGPGGRVAGRSQRPAPAAHPAGAAAWQQQQWRWRRADMPAALARGPPGDGASCGQPGTRRLPGGHPVCTPFPTHCCMRSCSCQRGSNGHGGGSASLLPCRNDKLRCRLLGTQVPTRGLCLTVPPLSAGHHSFPATLPCLLLPSTGAAAGPLPR